MSLPPATPAPTPNLTRSPATVVVEFLKVRLDDPAAPTREMRTFAFTTDRAGDISASLFRTTGGRIEVCLVPAAPGATPAPGVGGDSFCDEFSQGTKRTRAPSRRQDWTVQLRATEAGQRPVTDVLLRFPAAAGAVSISGFPFRGTDVADENGFTARLVTDESGPLRVAGSWTDNDGDSTHDWGLSVFDVTDGARVVYRTAGTASSMDAHVVLRSERRFEVTLGNRVAFTSARVTLNARLTWP